MLTWIDDSNKYEQVWRAYFGSYEITIFKLNDNNYIAYTRAVGGTSLCRCEYSSNYTIEEVKEKYVEDLIKFLDERVVYWMTIQHDLWRKVQWLDEEDE